MEAISIKDFTAMFIRNNPGLSESQLVSKLQRALSEKEKGAVCLCYLGRRQCDMWFPFMFFLPDWRIR